MSKNPGPAVRVKPIEVVVTHSFEDAFKRFKKLVQSEKIVGQVKDRMEYKKPSEKRRKKRRDAEERKRIQLLREKQIESGEWDRKKRKREKKKAEKLENKIKRQERSDFY